MYLKFYWGKTLFYFVVLKKSHVQTSKQISIPQDNSESSSSLDFFSFVQEEEVETIIVHEAAQHAEIQSNYSVPTHVEPRSVNSSLLSSSSGGYEVRPQLLCATCKKTFKSKKSLSNHRSRMHRGPKNEPTSYMCHNCDKSYQTPYNLNRHKCKTWVRLQKKDGVKIPMIMSGLLTMAKDSKRK